MRGGRGRVALIAALAALTACAPVYSGSVAPGIALPAGSVDRRAPARAATEDAPEREAVRTPATRGASALNPALVDALESLVWPLAADGTGLLSSRYGDRVHPRGGDQRFHTGLDLRATGGTPVYAAAAGTVALSGASGAYGNVVLLDHGGGLQTLYAHHERNLVGVGDQVRRGQTVATAGSSGSVSSPQVHFELRKGAKPVNPLDYLAGA